MEQRSLKLSNKSVLLKGIMNIFRSANIDIRKINSIRRYISDTAVRTLVESIVIARLNYCTSVCMGLPTNRLQRHQLVQNSADNAYPRWATLTADQQTVWVQNTALNFISMNGCAPEYFCDMLNVLHAWYIFTIYCIYITCAI